jgi:site-specific DNA-methyltransferase (adenine-specific)
MTWTLKQGDWRDELADIKEVDAIITDPPFGARTHKGDAAAAVQQKSATGQSKRRPIAYKNFHPADVFEFVYSWQHRNKGWWICITSHDLIPAWEQAFREIGLYSFAPLPFIRKVPRLLGDGPASWADYIMAARPRNINYSRWGCRPGAYVLEKGHYERKKIAVGGKPIWLMKKLVEDYTKPGNTVCDPFAGGATTLAAATMLGRKSVGCELREEIYQKALERLSGITTESDAA